MADAQLRLFADPKPLLDRFGAEFFRRIPKRPGIYVMGDEAGRVLYIGKARNLRQRLCSYKYPQGSRKVARLSWRVRSITWEICDDGIAAGLRENELLRLHKPVFNVMNTRSEHYPFIGLQLQDANLKLRFTKSSQPLRGEHLFGAFKGLPLARSAFAALLRLLWLADNPAASLFELPMTLLNGKSTEYSVAKDLCEPELLHAFLAGQSDALLVRFSECRSDASPFERSFVANDLELLREFFERGPRRNSSLRQIFGLAKPIVSQSEIDDLIVLREQYAAS